MASTQYILIACGLVLMMMVHGGEISRRLRNLHLTTMWKVFFPVRWAATSRPPSLAFTQLCNDDNQRCDARRLVIRYEIWSGGYATNFKRELSGCEDGRNKKSSKVSRVKVAIKEHREEGKSVMTVQCEPKIELESLIKVSKIRWKSRKFLSAEEKRRKLSIWSIFLPECVDSLPSRERKLGKAFLPDAQLILAHMLDVTGWLQKLFRRLLCVSIASRRAGEWLDFQGTRARFQLKCHSYQRSWSSTFHIIELLSKSIGSTKTQFTWIASWTEQATMSYH